MTRRRSLTSDEIARARRVFGDSVDYGSVRVTRGALASLGSDRTLGNTVHLRDHLFSGDGLALTERGRSLLMHELGHVWQYQHFGLRYIPASLLHQFLAFVRTGSRNAAYDWRRALAQGRRWEKWNPEQQAQAIQHYDSFLTAQETGRATQAQERNVAALEPLLARLRVGSAPRRRSTRGGPR